MIKGKREFKREPREQKPSKAESNYSVKLSKRRENNASEAYDN